MRPPFCFDSQLGSPSWSGPSLPISALLPHSHAVFFITGSALHSATAGKQEGNREGNASILPTCGLAVIALRQMLGLP